ncbi:MAG: chitobiase/beta-hexosaminidase C-terminal domain-containing protein [Methylacidiphilales bacterium]|nr:chitobiase/beta-hexosaminidase C-terminal domain-containing protein [Candidatus Methylacidiphilales bacterium]
MNFRKAKWLGLAILLTGLCVSNAAAQVATPVLAVTGVNNSQQTISVSISDSTVGATIRYTTNGTTPTTSSSIITSGGTLNLSQSNTLEVLVFSGSATSDLVTAQYTTLGLISSSGDHAVVINKDGTVSSWGNGASGQLGAGNSSSSNLPVQTQITSGTAFTGAYPVRALTSTTLSPLPVTLGLTAWFDATSGVTSSSGVVSGWKDLSGNGYNLTPYSGLGSPTLGTDPYSGNPMLTFNGSQGLSNPAEVNAPGDMTIITVAAATNSMPFDQEYTIVDMGTSFGYYYSKAYEYFNYNGQVQSFQVGQGATAGGGVGGLVPVGPELEVTSVTYAESNADVAFYSQGLPNGSTVASTGTTGLGYGLNMGFGSNNNWVGNIAAVLIYNRILSQTERQAVEAYLAVKYSLVYNVPAPVVAPNGGTVTATTPIVVSGAPAPFIIRYTLDGTAPTGTSRIYNNGFTLSQSAPFNCAVFENNVQISPNTTAQFYVGDSGSIGISDAWQIYYFGHTGINPAALSPGGSGLTNLQDYLYGYNPNLFSTNGDGLSDATNHLLGYSATDLNISSDGLTNAQNLALGLDPFGPNTLPSPLPPNPTDHTAPTITLYNPQGATLVP